MDTTTQIAGTLRQQLFDMITPEHICNRTSIFSLEGFDKGRYDKVSMEAAKARYKNYFESWIEEPAKKFILNEGLTEEKIIQLIRNLADLPKGSYSAYAVNKLIDRARDMMLGG